jgi:hypothetical protein
VCRSVRSSAGARSIKVRPFCNSLTAGPFATRLPMSKLGWRNAGSNRYGPWSTSPKRAGCIRVGRRVKNCLGGRYNDGGVQTARGYRGARPKPQPQSERWKRGRRWVLPHRKLPPTWSRKPRDDQGLTRRAGSEEQKPHAKGWDHPGRIAGAGRPMPFAQDFTKEQIRADKGHLGSIENRMSTRNQMQGGPGIAERPSRCKAARDSAQKKQARKQQRRTLISGPGIRISAPYIKRDAERNKLHDRTSTHVRR